jgi:hypothetical protein
MGAEMNRWAMRGRVMGKQADNYWPRCGPQRSIDEKGRKNKSKAMGGKVRCGKPEERKIIRPGGEKRGSLAKLALPSVKKAELSVLPNGEAGRFTRWIVTAHLIHWEN